jgi:hypothetical protein
MPDIAVRPIVWSAIAIAAVVGGVVLAVMGLLRLDGVSPGGDRFRNVDAAGGQPSGLYAAPQPELARVRKEKDARLHSFGWVDRARGVAHIPIEDAMDLLAAQQQGEKR